MPACPRLRGGDQRCARPHKRIQHQASFAPMQLETTEGQPDREAGRVIELLRLGLDCLVGDEPHVASASPVLLVSPACDVGLVFERHSDGKTVDLDRARLGELEHGFVVLIEKAAAGDRRLKCPTVSSPMLIDLTQVMWFCRTNSGDRSRMSAPSEPTLTPSTKSWTVCACSASRAVRLSSPTSPLRSGDISGETRDFRP